MSEQLHCWVSSSATATGLHRSIAGAFLLSVAVHASLVGVLSQSTWMRQHAPSQHELRVELSSRAISTAEASSIRTVARPKMSNAARKNKETSDRRVSSAYVSTKQAPESAPELPETGSSPAPKTESPLDDQNLETQERTLPFDLRVLDWLAHYRTYPLAARRARIEGVVHLRVTLMPDGRLLAARVELSSGHSLLDRAALDLLARASPLPASFGTMRTEQIELQLPIVYRMSTSST